MQFSLYTLYIASNNNKNVMEILSSHMTQYRWAGKVSCIIRHHFSKRLLHDTGNVFMFHCKIFSTTITSWNKACFCGTGGTEQTYFGMSRYWNVSSLGNWKEVLFKGSKLEVFYDNVIYCTLVCCRWFLPSLQACSVVSLLWKMSGMIWPHLLCKRMRLHISQRDGVIKYGRNMFRWKCRMSSANVKSVINTHTGFSGGTLKAYLAMLFWKRFTTVL